MFFSPIEKELFNFKTIICSRHQIVQNTNIFRLPAWDKSISALYIISRLQLNTT